MHSRSLHLPATTALARGLAAAWQRVCAWQARSAAQRRLARAERALATMSLHGLRDIGAPEALLLRRQHQDELQRLELRAWHHLRS